MQNEPKSSCHNAPIEYVMRCTQCKQDTGEYWKFRPIKLPLIVLQKWKKNRERRT